MKYSFKSQVAGKTVKQNVKIQLKANQMIKNGNLIEFLKHGSGYQIL